MKKSIEVTHEWVPMFDGKLVTAVHVKKAKGELTLPEIKDAIKENIGDDFYLLFLDLYNSPDEIQYDEDIEGDIATVYIAADLMGLTAGDYD